VLNAFIDGARRVAAAPTIVIGVYVATLLLSVPLALVVRDAIARDLGDSTAAGRMADGVDADWWQEFMGRTDGLAATFRPAVIGFAAPLDNLDTLLDNRPRALAIAGATAAYLTLWAFLIGGIIDRYARRRATRPEGFFVACGVYFVRFLRLAIVGGLAYYVLFGHVHGWLLDDLYDRLTHDVTVERTGFQIRLALYGLFGLLLGAVNIVIDYAKIRMVVEDRRSAIGAVLAAARFVWRRPRPTLGLYAINGLAFLIVLSLYRLVSPGVTAGGLTAAAVVLLGQVYVVTRLMLRLLFHASQTALFQRELAHAGYTAAPLPTWPESPAAEAIGIGEP